MCVCACMCASCSLHFYTCSRFSYFHAARTFYPTPLAFIFALFFAHFYLSACLQFWTLFFLSLLMLCRCPARTISKVPLRSNVLDKLKEQKVKSAQQQHEQRASSRQQESGRVAAAAPIYASFIAVCLPSVGLRLWRSLPLSLTFCLSATSNPGRVPCLSLRRRSDFWRKWWSLLTIFLLIYSGPWLNSNVKTSKRYVIFN